jgi:hypothetical protein
MKKTEKQETGSRKRRRRFLLFWQEKQINDWQTALHGEMGTA